MASCVSLKYAGVFDAMARGDVNGARDEIRSHLIGIWTARVGRDAALDLLKTSSSALDSALIQTDAPTAKLCLDLLGAIKSVAALASEARMVMESRGVGPQLEDYRGRIFPPTLSGFLDVPLEEKVAMGDALLRAIAACEDAHERTKALRPMLRGASVAAGENDERDHEAAGERAYLEALSKLGSRDPAVRALLADGGLSVYLVATCIGVVRQPPKTQDEVNKAADRWDHRLKAIQKKWPTPARFPDKEHSLSGSVAVQAGSFPSVSEPE